MNPTIGITAEDTSVLERSMDKYRRHVDVMARECFDIMNDEELCRTRLRFSESQKRLLAVRDQIKYVHKQPVRIIDLKTRQVYSSTATNAIAFDELYFAPDARRHTVVSYDWKSTKEIMAMTFQLAQYLPDWLRRPYSVNRSDGTFKWDDTGANIDSVSGEKSDPGRGGNRYFLHVSEAPMFRDPVNLMNALLPSVPEEPGTSIIIESTARGYDRFFQPRWVEAVERTRDIARSLGAVDEMDLLFNRTGWGGDRYPNGYWPGGYFPVFIPWFTMRKYRKDPELLGLTADKLTKLERSIMETHKLDLAQMAFRRWKVADMGGSRVYRDDDSYVKEFNQEFPDTPENAYKNSGATFLGATTIALGSNLANTKAREVYTTNDGKQRRILQPVAIRWKKGSEPKYNSLLECTNRNKIAPQVFPVSTSELTIWKTPYRDPQYNRTIIENGIKRTYGSQTWSNRYVLGIDISEGGTVQGDYSVIYVLDRVYTEFVAQYRGRPTPLELAEIAAMIAIYYDRAWIMGEYNDQGPSVVPRLQSLYDLVCARPEISAGRGDEQSDRYWFLTSAKSKRLLADHMREAIEAKPAMMPFPEFWTDAKVFVQGGDWKLGAEGKRLDKSVKNYDDCIIAAGQAIVGHIYSPIPVENIEPRYATDHVKRQFRATHLNANRGAIDAVPEGLQRSKVL